MGFSRGLVIRPRPAAQLIAGWSYEKERRVHFPLGQPSDGVYYKDFDEVLQLREVILGPRCTLKPSEVADAVSNPPLDVDIYATRVAFGRFEVCKQELVSMHTAKGWRDRVKKLPDLYDDQLPSESLEAVDADDNQPNVPPTGWGRDE